MSNFITQFWSYKYCRNTCEILVKFRLMVYLLYTLLVRFRYYRAMSSLLVLIQYLNSGVFLVKTNFSVREFGLHFPTMAPEKACVVVSSEVVLGVPDYGAGNIRIEISSSQEDVRLALDHGVGVRPHDAWAVHGALDLGVGVRPFCKLQNVPYWEW